MVVAPSDVSTSNEDALRKLPLKAHLARVRKAAESAIKWLNGLPTEEPHFDPDRIAPVDRPAAVARDKNRLRRRLLRRKSSRISPEPEEAKRGPGSGKSRIFQIPAMSGIINTSSNPQQQFGNNAVKAAKYSLLTFVPKNLYEQFHRVANFYFLLVIVLQFIPAVSNVSPWLAMMPLTIIVLATATKDGLEDWKRHKSDNTVNYSLARVLRSAHSPVTPIPTTYSTAWQQDSTRSSITQKVHGWLFRVKQTVFGFSALKEQDTGSVNRWKAKYWRDIAVGDLVLVRDGDPIPADLLIVSTSEADGKCFVETMNLDGETNLKIKYSLPETQWVQSVDDATELQMLVETELPSSNMHSLHGKVIIPRYDSIQPREDVIAVTLQEVLLRGCTLRNTDWIIGCAIFTGPDTKLMLNTGVTPSKRSRIERQINPQIVLSFVLLFVICVACSIVQAGVTSSSISDAPYWYSTFGSKVYASSWFTGFLTFWSSMVLFQTLVPISLYITVEVCKTIQAYFIHEDLQLYDPEQGKKCVPRAWNISDDLGQIEYLFSDKTGTLTRNVMEFRQCCINGQVYGHLPDDPTVDWDRLRVEMHGKLAEMHAGFTPPSRPSFVDPQLVAGMQQRDDVILEFVKLMALCHTVLCSSGRPDDGGQVEYKAQSPDEEALVKSARDLGVVFFDRHQDVLQVQLFGQVKTFTLLEVIEFTSTRKRMTVILRDQDTHNLVLYCKGADNVIMERLCADSNPEQVVEETMLKLEQFAASGLRTLCLAKRTLSDGEFSDWQARYRQASAAMEDRERLMDAEADCIEQNLELLGATAIEDRLQEGVPECIETLQQAGIKVWILTGDKLETAINIAHSCRLMDAKTSVLVVKGSDGEEVQQQLKAACEQYLGDPSAEYAMVIEGHSLLFALQQSLRNTFIQLACRCKSVVCCRTSPLQKAKVVELVRRTRNAMTLAVGDGANDVSMLQAADVGVGVSGAEGVQAVMASDYAITQFRHLGRLLLLHGRWSYHRSAQATLCSFHKNIAFVVCGFWYQWSCAFTSNYIYDYMYANFFNILLAMPPIVMLGCFDQDVSEQAAIGVPQLYRQGIRQGSYSLSLFLLYMLNGLWQSAVCFFIPKLSYADTVVDVRGHPESRTFLGNAVGLSVIICVNAFVLFNTKAWNGLVVAGFVATVLAVFLLMIVCALVPGMTLFGSISQFREPRFYAIVVLAIAVAITPQLLFKYSQCQLWPDDVDIVREFEKCGRASTGGGDVDIYGPLLHGDAIASARHQPAAQSALQQPPPPPPKSRLSRTLSKMTGKLKRRKSVADGLSDAHPPRHTGYAFSQQDRGTASIVLPRSPSPME